MSTSIPSSGAVPGIVFNKEIMSMMHAFGDNVCPLIQSVELIDRILCEQIDLLLYKTHEVAVFRGSKVMGVEDLLFLMRKDRIKLNRLLNYLAAKDFNSHALLDLPSDVSESSAMKEQAPNVRKQICIEFLESIDQTGELTDKKQPFDPIKKERLIRAETISQSLDGNRYFEYAGARRTSFIYHFGKRNKVHEWLIGKTDKFPDLPKNNPLFYEILAYLAYETVAQIVDVALLVRQDGAAKLGDPFSYYMAGFNRMPGSYPAQYSAELTGKQLTGPPPITPLEIKEALRRFWFPLLCPWSPFSRSLPQTLYMKLIAC